MSNIEHFRALAIAASRQAEEASLPSVRERCERSAAAWNAIVAQMLDTEHFTSVNLAAKQAA
ncbi:MAG: hypothetical protein Q7J32_19010 [Sphingomonadaceae bacterium]|nr:hypothetical protein [Sphingomonadaceae bacterium]